MVGAQLGDMQVLSSLKLHHRPEAGTNSYQELRWHTEYKSHRSKWKDQQSFSKSSCYRLEDNVTAWKLMLTGVMVLTPSPHPEYTLQ